MFSKRKKEKEKAFSLIIVSTEKERLVSILKYYRVMSLLSTIIKYLKSIVVGCKRNETELKDICYFKFVFFAGWARGVLRSYKLLFETFVYVVVM